MNKDIYIPLLICAVSIAAFSWVALTISAVWIFVPAVIITFLIYLNTFFKKIPDPMRILPLYLLALGIQMLHFAEEYLTDFVVVLPRLIGQEPYPIGFWLSFNMVAYFVFILGGIVLFKQSKAFAVIPLFFILVGAVLNPIAHLGLTLSSGSYFPGLYTSLVYFLLIPFFYKAILPDNRK